MLAMYSVGAAGGGRPHKDDEAAGASNRPAQIISRISALSAAGRCVLCLPAGLRSAIVDSCIGDDEKLEEQITRASTLGSFPHS